ncbi:hypothetical protein GO755_35050 [Spirosoma sp. HMF4905]|uniref:Uncharacterized protein n=1 Tax=Spirosoma arboris TaxID=2682092 RepID=A0A7K1SNR2_9BACT|nr:hypothetical protein [Spirosoma arboris]MVM35293.1 hypothetical protein [Spirosoma arboris]
MIYLSDRNFRIWAYTVSHYSLLLRSPLLLPDEDGYSDRYSYNIDLEFWAVEYISIPTSISSIALKEINFTDLPEELIGVKQVGENKIFEITSGSRKYYIIAAGCLIGKNRWEREDRIFNANLNLEHDEILRTF